MKKFTFSLLIFIPILCLGQIFYVPDEYATIQEGIDAANDGDTVLVAPGTYVEHLDILSKTITLGSHFLTTGDTNYIHSTVIDGNEDGIVLQITEAEEYGRLCGFTIQNGFTETDFGAGILLWEVYFPIDNMVIENCVALRGGGIAVQHSGLNLYNTRITGNEATDRGGGVYVRNADVYLENCRISGNQSPSGAGMYFYINSIQPDFHDLCLKTCALTENVGFGQTGGLVIRREGSNNMLTVEIAECDFINNSSGANGALQIRGDSIDFLIWNSRISGNTVQDYTAGIACQGGCTGELINCLITDNTANLSGNDWNGGGLTLWGQGVEVGFRNCTFANNSAAYGEAVTLGPGATAYYTNNIFWDNGNNPIALLTFDTTGATAYMDYNNLQYGIDSIRVDQNAELNWGDHNMTGNPLFKGSGNDLYSITSNSACLDMGTPDTTGMGLLPFDILGNVRIWDGGSGTARIDIGAYEYGAPAWLGIEEPGDVLLSAGREVLIYPNPARDQIHILCEERFVEVRVFNQCGKVLLREGSCETLDVSALNRGFYFVEVLFPDGRDCRKLIIN
jgi:hypothetical protein